jgi:UDP-N-acetylglucosamine/UDP-N-acetylgalactosamine diphosphorylase
MQDAFDRLSAIAAKHGQSHLFQFWDQLSLSQRQFYLDQLETIDFDQIAKLFSGHEESIDWTSLANKAQSPDAIRLNDPNASFTAQQARECGEQAIKDGKVAMIMVAGGQGTRLGFDQPKGMFRIGPVSNRTLFAMHVDSLRGAMRKYGVSIPFCVMTSPATDIATREYFDSHRRLGLSAEELIIFCQGTMPAIDASSGKILMDSPSSIALSPDGHGGIVSALDRNGIFKAAADRGIEHFFYAQVDNPLVRACDPTLIGYHLLAKSQMTTQVVSKRFPTEKVGNVVSIDGRTHIIEYSDLPESAAISTNPDGSLRLWAGNIAVHILDLAFLIDASKNNSGLPFHRAHKAVPYVDSHGQSIKPASPNAIKFERFVFDLLPLAGKAIVVEGDPKEVFAPVKNADGAATDTPTTAKQAIVEQHKRWLEQSGIHVPDNVKVEINPYWALDVEEVQKKIQKLSNIMVDTYFA